ncbi:hypothetical protein [Clostridium sp. DL1XJH146]
MMKLKKMIVPTILIINILMCSVVFAENIGQDAEISVSNIEMREFLPGKGKRDENLKKREEHKIQQLEIIEKADKIVPGIKSQWEEAENELDELREQMHSKNEKMKEEKEKVRSEILSKVDKGEMTKEEGKEYLENLREENRNMNEINKENREARRQKCAVDWKSFKEAVEKEDKDGIEKSFKSILENKNEQIEEFKELLK